MAEPRIDKKLSKSDRREVIMLTFCSQILTQLTANTKEESRRFNKLSTALGNLKKADDTYHGYMTDEDLIDASEFLSELEARVNTFLDKEEPDEESV